MLYVDCVNSFHADFRGSVREDDRPADPVEPRAWLHHGSGRQRDEASQIHRLPQEGHGDSSEGPGQTSSRFITQYPLHGSFKIRLFFDSFLQKATQTNLGEISAFPSVTRHQNVFHKRGLPKIVGERNGPVPASESTNEPTQAPRG